MRPDEWNEVAALIFDSTNAWYQRSGKPPIFGGDSSDCLVFCETYEALDPGCCLLLEERATGRIVGSCFYHPRPTHISIGIVNVRPEFFGKGVARRMLAEVITRAESENKPLRLVSSAQNLDSFSLYTRVGFVPRMAFQDMLLRVPDDGNLDATGPSDARVREATLNDLPAIVGLEREISGIEREGDWRHFLANASGIWHVSALPAADGNGLDGVLASVCHPGSHLIGPGVARTEEVAAALLRAELSYYPGRTPLFLVPVECAGLVRQAYAWGAVNCEIHFAQVRGTWTPPRGVVLPTFLPESG